MRSTSLLLGFGLALSALTLGCPTSTTITPTGGNGGNACNPGQTAPCTCKDGSDGTIECKPDGSGFGVCGPCHNGTGGAGGAGTGGSGGQDPCGDGFCAADEDCHTCDADCFCDPCLYKACAGATIPPASLQHYPQLDVALEAIPPEQIQEMLSQRVASGDVAMRILARVLSPQRGDESFLAKRLRAAMDPRSEAMLRRSLSAAGMYDPAAYDQAFPEADVLPEVLGGFETMEVPPGGTESCGAPLLRVRLASVLVTNPDDDVASDLIYCAVTSEAGAGGETRVTPITQYLSDGQTHTWSIDEGIVWGQLGPRSPEGNLLLTWNCFEQDDNSSYTTLIDTIATEAEKVGGVIGGQYGWVFQVVASLGSILSQAIVLDGDDYLLNIQQNIDASVQLDMTNGYYWNVHKWGEHGFLQEYDWTLRVEAWGCAEYGTL